MPYSSVERLNANFKKYLSLAFGDYAQGYAALHYQYLYGKDCTMHFIVSLCHLNRNMAILKIIFKAVFYVLLLDKKMS